MNVLFVGKRRRDNSSGIEKKMMGQIRALERLGHKVYYTFFENGIVWLATTDGMQEEIITYKENVVSMYLANEYAVRKIIKKGDIQFSLFYMRKGMASYWHLNTLKVVKNANITLIEEIPTYPYDKELWKTPGMGLKIHILLDILFRNSLKKYVDYFVTYSEDEEIYGVPCICVTNGIDVLEIPKRDILRRNKKLTIATVSAMYYWHGYERLIKGLYEYLLTKRDADDFTEVYIDMIGDGPCRNEWEKLTGDLGLVRYITFHGLKQGQELDEILSRCDVAVGSLGLYKKKLYKASELKIREYCARGIPFILGCHDLGLDGLEEYVLQVPNDSSSINIKKIVDFISGIEDVDSCTEEMREYARRKFDWTNQFEKILQYVECEG